MVSRIKREQVMEQDQILNELTYIRERINASSRILTDKAKSAFFFVLVPEELIILDTQKAADLFAKFDVPLSGYVVNRMLPEGLAELSIPEYLKNRITMQKKYLADIKDKFDGQVLAYVPEMERDVTGLPMIEKLAHIMYGDF
jgi:arsenite-transporting ATPase